jgi:hypothetical protein
LEQSGFRRHSAVSEDGRDGRASASAGCNEAGNIVTAISSFREENSRNRPEILPAVLAKIVALVAAVLCGVTGLNALDVDAQA